MNFSVERDKTVKSKEILKQVSGLKRLRLGSIDPACMDDEFIDIVSSIAGSKKFIIVINKDIVILEYNDINNKFFISLGLNFIRNIYIIVNEDIIGIIPKLTFILKT